MVHGELAADEVHAARALDETHKREDLRILGGPQLEETVNL